MNYNYPQQNQSYGYGGYKPAPQYPQWGPSQPQPPQQVRPVSSIEEARACPIDFDGSVFYFADVANKRIYTKQINLDGTAQLNVYELKTDLVANTSQYVTKTEFDNVVNKLYEVINPLIENPAENIMPSVAQPKKPVIEF